MYISILSNQFESTWSQWRETWKIQRITILYVWGIAVGICFMYILHLLPTPPIAQDLFIKAHARVTATRALALTEKITSSWRLRPYARTIKQSMAIYCTFNWCFLKFNRVPPHVCRIYLRLLHEHSTWVELRVSIRWRKHIKRQYCCMIAESLHTPWGDKVSSADL